MTIVTATAILSRPPADYVPPSKRGSELGYDQTRNRRDPWVDRDIEVPPVLGRDAYTRDLT
jgi:hypothetical protein